MKNVREGKKTAGEWRCLTNLKQSHEKDADEPRSSHPSSIIRSHTPTPEVESTRDNRKAPTAEEEPRRPHHSISDLPPILIRSPRVASRRVIRSIGLQFLRPVPFRPGRCRCAQAPASPRPPKAAAVAVPSIPPASLSHPSKPNPMVPPVDCLRHRRPRRLLPAFFLGPRARLLL